MVAFAASIPLSMGFRNGQGKWLLRQVLNQYVPRELIERPKMGFGVPIDTWLRGPLREWAEELLDERRLQAEVCLAAPIHRSGRNTSPVRAIGNIRFGLSSSFRRGVSAGRRRQLTRARSSPARR